MSGHTKETTVFLWVLFAAYIAVLLLGIAIGHNKPPRIVRETVPAHVARLTVERDDARLRADALLDVAAEKWVTTTGKRHTCGLCGAKWQGERPRHGVDCILATPEWRASR